jgi:hypothetical protein
MRTLPAIGHAGPSERHDGTNTTGANMVESEPNGVVESAAREHAIRTAEKNPHGMNRKARRALSSDNRRNARATRKAINRIENLQRRGAGLASKVS